ncbi:MAG: hypothetical protein R2865_09390 [Deinococcales bacterium]
MMPAWLWLASDLYALLLHELTHLMHLSYTTTEKPMSLLCTRVWLLNLNKSVAPVPRLVY